MLHALANGDDLRTVECDRGRKSYGEENTFLDDVTEREQVEAMIIAHSETVARRVRRDGVRGRTVTLKYRPSGPTAQFKLITRSRTLAEASDNGREIAAVAMALWDREPPGQALRLVGVQLSGLDGERPVQLGLFQGGEAEGRDGRDQALNQALDDIVKRFGADAVKRGRK